MQTPRIRLSHARPRRGHGNLENAYQPPRAFYRRLAAQSAHAHAFETVKQDLGQPAR